MKTYSQKIIKTVTLTLSIFTFLFSVEAQSIDPLNKYTKYTQNTDQATFASNTPNTETFDKERYLNLHTDYNYINKPPTAKSDNPATTLLNEVGGVIHGAIGSTDSDNVGDLSGKITQGITSHLKNQAINKTETLINNKANQLIKQLGSGRSEISINGIESERLQYEIKTIQPLSELNKNSRQLTFLQAQFATSENHGRLRNTFNLGIGQRYLLEGGRSIVGFNLFTDYESRSRHKRASLGLEYQRTNFSTHINRYYPLSARKDIGAYTEEVQEGHDIKLIGQVPYLPWAKVKGTRYFWKGVQEADVKGTIFGVEIALSPSSHFEFGTKDEDDDRSSYLRLSTTLPLGENDKQTQFFIADQAFQTDGLMDLDSLNFVERSNKIRVEKVLRSTKVTMGKYSAKTENATCTLIDSTGTPHSGMTEEEDGAIELSITPSLPAGLIRVSCVGGKYKNAAQGEIIHNAPTLRAAINYTDGDITIFTSPLSEIAYQLAVGNDASGATLENKKVATAFNTKEINTLNTKPLSKGDSKGDDASDTTLLTNLKNNIARENKAIANAFDIGEMNILNTKPTDLNNPKVDETNSVMDKFAWVLASISKMYETKTKTDAKAELTRLATSYKKMREKGVVDFSAKSHTAKNNCIQGPEGNDGKPKGYACDGSRGLKMSMETNTTVAENEKYEYEMVIKNKVGDLTYTLSGKDKDKFTVGATTGTLSMEAKDYEKPEDKDKDNKYEITITATDSRGVSKSASQTITVTNVFEGDPININAVTFDIDEDIADDTSVGTPIYTGNISNYAITEGDADAAFKISDSGEILVNDTSKIVYATRNQYILTVKINAADADVADEEAQIIINIVDVSKPVVAFENSSSEANEANSVQKLTVKLDAASGTKVIVHYTVSGTATGTGANADYTLADGTLTFAPGVTTQDISLQIKADNVEENNETVIVTLSSNNLENATLGTEKTHTHTISDALIFIDQTFNINENSDINTPVGTLITQGKPTTFTITNGNTDNAFKIDNSGAITVNANVLDAESLSSYPLTVQIGREGAILVTATITIGINDITEFVQFSASAATSDEVESTQKITVKLNKKNSQVVTVNYVISGTATTPEDFTAYATDTTDPIDTMDIKTPIPNNVVNTLTFNQGETEKVITLQIKTGQIDEVNKTIVITLSNPTNALLNSVKTYTYTIADNNTQGITQSKTALTVPEAGVATYTLTLNTQPTTSDVIITPISSNTDAATVSEALTFTSSNWDTPQTITVTGVDDGNVTNETFDIAHTIVSTGDYKDITLGVVTVNTTDDDTVGVSVSKTSITTSESGDKSTFTIQLDSQPQPSINVSIGLSSSDTTEGTVTPTSITFTNADWNIPQTITVTGVDDDSRDGDQSYNIITTKTTSSDRPIGDIKTTQARYSARFSAKSNAKSSASPSASGYNDLAVDDVSASNVDTDRVFSISGISPAISIDENTPFTSATPSISGDTPFGKLTYSLKADDDKAHFTVNADTGVISMAPHDYENPEDAEDLQNTYKTTLIATDEGGNTATQTVVVHVQDVLEFEELSTSFLSSDLYLISTTSSATKATITLQLRAKHRNLNKDDLAILQGHASPEIVTTSSNAVITSTTNNEDGTYTAEISPKPGISNISEIFTVSATIDTLNIPGIELEFISGWDKAYTAVANPRSVIADGNSKSTITATLKSTENFYPDFKKENLEFRAVNNDGTASTATLGTITQKTFRYGDDNCKKSIYGSFCKGIFSIDITSTTVGLVKIKLVNIPHDEMLTTTTVNFITPSLANKNATLTTNPTSVIANNIESIITLQVKDGAGNPLILPSTTPVTMVTNSNNATLSAITAHDNGRYTATIKSTVAETVEITAKINNQPVVEKAQVIFINGVIVSKHTVTTAETGSTESFSIRLAQKPTSNVTINLSSSDLTEGTISPTSIIFTPSNWNETRNITVTGIDDDINDGTIDYKIITTATSTDPTYDGISVSVNARNLSEGDIAGISVSAISGDTTKKGGEATFTIQLDSKPTSKVSFYITTSNKLEGRLKPSLTIDADILDILQGRRHVKFTPSNWKVPQTFTVIGQNDSINDYDVTYQIVMQGSVDSTDPKYASKTFPPITVKNISNPIDGIGIIVSKDTVTTSEIGNTDSFSIRLMQQPTSNVTIDLMSSNLAEGTISPTSIIFTPSDWNKAKNITVTGVDDDIDDDTIDYKIIATATSTDPVYNGVSMSVNAHNLSGGDTAGISVSAISGDTTKKGGEATFTIQLDSEPTSKVSFYIGTSNDDEGVLKPSSTIHPADMLLERRHVEFTPSNWKDPQTFTVIGQKYGTSDHDVTYQIVMQGSVDSADPKYASKTFPPITVKNISASLIFDKKSVVVAESGGRVQVSEFGFNLSSAITSDMRVLVQSADSRVRTNTKYYNKVTFHRLS